MFCYNSVHRGRDAIRHELDMQHQVETLCRPFAVDRPMDLA